MSYRYHTYRIFLIFAALAGVTLLSLTIVMYLFGHSFTSHDICRHNLNRLYEHLMVYHITHTQRSSKVLPLSRDDFAKSAGKQDLQEALYSMLLPYAYSVKYSLHCPNDDIDRDQPDSFDEAFRSSSYMIVTEGNGWMITEKRHFHNDKAYVLRYNGAITLENISDY